MKKNILCSLLLVVVFWSFAYCDDPKPIPPAPVPTPVIPSKPTIVAPKDVSGTGTKKDPYVFTSMTRCILTLSGTTGSEKIEWDINTAPSDSVVLDSKYLSFSLFEGGLFDVTAHGPDVYSKIWFSIKSGTDPPGPAPTPGPGPGPSPTPIPPSSQITVVVVKDGMTLSKLPQSQLQALLSSRVRDYCDKHCLKGADNKTPEFKIYEKDTVVDKQSANIQKAFKTAIDDMSAAKSNGPWIAISNGTTGYSGPYPVTEIEVLDLLKKYGGE